MIAVYVPAATFDEELNFMEMLLVSYLMSITTSLPEESLTVQVAKVPSSLPNDVLCIVHVQMPPLGVSAGLVTL